MNTAPKIALVTDARFGAHVAPGFHPERPERLSAAVRGAERAVGASGLRVAARAATDEELTRVHTPAYVASLEASLRRGSGYLDGDTFFSAGSHDAAWHAAGGACAMVDAIVEGRAEMGLHLARPPGHHATPSRAMGFCLLNNVAIAAAHARSRGVERVAIVDWDVHHGNGTQDAFARDPNVLYLSLHQSPLYPGTGAASEVGVGEGTGATVNLPLPPGSGPGSYVAAFERIVLPIVAEQRPDLVLVSAGFDAHARDPLASMALSSDAYGWMAARLREVVLSLGHGRIALVLEGGYDLSALEESVEASVRGMLDPARAAHLEGNPDAPGAAQALQTALAVQRTYWYSALS